MVFQWTVKVFCRNLVVAVGDLVVTGYGLMIWNDAANQTVSKEMRKHWCIAFMIIQLITDIQYKSSGYVAESRNLRNNSNYEILMETCLIRVDDKENLMGLIPLTALACPLRHHF